MATMKITDPVPVQMILVSSPGTTCRKCDCVLTFSDKAYWIRGYGLKCETCFREPKANKHTRR